MITTALMRHTLGNGQVDTILDTPRSTYLTLTVSVTTPMMASPMSLSRRLRTGEYIRTCLPGHWIERTMLIWHHSYNSALAASFKYPFLVIALPVDNHFHSITGMANEAA